MDRGGLVIKPHHLLDIFKLYGKGVEKFVPDERYNHDFYRVGNRVIENRVRAVEFTCGNDDICRPCVCLKQGVCGDRFVYRGVEHNKNSYNEELEHSIGPSQLLDYPEEWKRWYTALREMNYDVDVIAPGDELSGYRLVVAPLWYMVKGEDDRSVRRFVKEGGTFVTGFFSGIVQENDLAVSGGYPGKLRDILGIWLEEWDALAADYENAFVYQGHTYPAYRLCDLVHMEHAKQVDEQGYCEDFYRGFPVVTKNEYGKGRAYYVATASSGEFYRAFLSDLCAEAWVEPVLRTPEGVEAAGRENENGSFVFLLNHTEEEKWVFFPWDGEELLGGDVLRAGEEVMLAPRGVMVVRK